MHYKVFVPPPRMKSMIKSAKLVITKFDSEYTYTELPAKLGEMRFEVSDEYVWSFSLNPISQVKRFTVKVQYQNESGNKKQSIELVPDKET